MALGLHLAGLGCKLHAMGVCDDPDYFYDYMDGLLKGMGADKATTGQLVMLLLLKGAALPCQHAGASRCQSLPHCPNVSI